MSKHLVREGNTIGWKKDPTEEDYILTYERPDTIGWKRGFGEREVLTKDGELIGWRNITLKETFPGEVFTSQLVNDLNVEHGWGNLPTINNGSVLVAEGFSSTHVWNPTLETLNSGTGSDNGIGRATFGVDVHLEIEYMVGNGPHPQMIYKGDVPAGTKVNLTGYIYDSFFDITVRGPQGNYLLEHNHDFNGVIEVRATKL